MKNRFMMILALFAVVGCGSPEQSGETDSPEPAVSASAEAPREAVDERASSGGDPCTALDASPVRYDAAGKHVAYTFEYPSGWEINELFSAGATSIDVTKNLDDQRIPEFVLRFGHVVGKPLDNPDKIVETWKKLPTTEEVMEIDVEGRTMYVARNRMGEMVGFQALFPDVTSDSKAWVVSGGVTRAPDGCEEEAIEAVERIIRSFAPNPDIGNPPGE